MVSSGWRGRRFWPEFLTSLYRSPTGEHQKVTRFLASGAATGSFGLGMNVFLVEIFGVRESVSYAFVLSTHMFVGYFLTRFYVFRMGNIGHVRSATGYVLAGVTFRILDWLLFTVQVELLSIYYIVAQLLNYAIFSTTKYLVFRRLFVGSRSVARSETAVLTSTADMSDDPE